MKTTRNIAGRDDGFTLMEVVIVVLVIGVLAGIAILMFDPFQMLAEEAAEDSEASILGVVCEAWDGTSDPEPLLEDLGVPADDRGPVRDDMMNGGCEA